MLTTIVLASVIALKFRPTWIERNLLRPYWLVRRREYATVVTSTFLHADMAHLLFNGFTFWAFAFGLERAIGTPRFLALYGFGVLASGVGTVLTHRGDPQYRCLGASGAILAVLFASIVYFPNSAIFILPIPLPIPAPLFALGYLAFTYVASRQSRSTVAHDAHLAGALAGIAFVALTDPQTLARTVHSIVG